MSEPDWVLANLRARAVLQPGDRVRRGLCCGRVGTFIFTGWDGNWICGRTISDCSARSITHVNGSPVDFSKD